MKPPGIEIDVTQPVQCNEDGREVPLPFQDIEIAGNWSGLLRLAELIRQVAESAETGYHIHLYPDDDETLLRTAAYSLTISKNSSR